MSCIEPDRNASEDVGQLQATLLHGMTDLAALIAEDPFARTALDPEMHRMTACAMRSIARNCGLNATT